MLNKEKHQLIMGRILRDIYSDTSISPIIGFKGGTCAYLFYNLSRFSVDLDFDLFLNDENSQQIVYEKVDKILRSYGEIKNQYIKRNTIFFLLSYGSLDYNIKIEINTRELIPNIKDFYEFKEYLGISMLVAQEEYLFTSKLVALTNRKSIAMRDIYDIWYFAKNNWSINSEIIKARTAKTIKEHITDCISTIETVKSNEILHGLAELLTDEKAKRWVKTSLKEETIFLLRSYQEIYSF